MPVRCKREISRQISSAFTLMLFGLDEIENFTTRYLYLFLLPSAYFFSLKSTWRWADDDHKLKEWKFNNCYFDTEEPQVSYARLYCISSETFGNRVDKTDISFTGRDSRKNYILVNYHKNSLSNTHFSRLLLVRWYNFIKTFKLINVLKSSIQISRNSINSTTYETF